MGSAVGEEEEGPYFSGPAWPRETHRALEGPGGKVWAAGPSCTRRLPRGSQPGRPTPPRDDYAPAGGRQRSVQDSGNHPCDGADPLGLPGTAPSLCRVLGHLSEAPGNSALKTK